MKVRPFEALLSLTWPQAMSDVHTVVQCEHLSELKWPGLALAELLFLTPSMGGSCVLHNAVTTVHNTGVS